MRASDVFDVTLERVRWCQANMYKIGAVNPEVIAHGGPPKTGNRLAEYVAEFELAGTRAIREYFLDSDADRIRVLAASGMRGVHLARRYGISESHVSRIIHGKRRRLKHRSVSTGTRRRMTAVFKLRFVDGLPYEVVVEQLRVTPSTMDHWCCEIKRVVGKELRRSGVFPPGRYFRERVKAYTANA